MKLKIHPDGVIGTVRPPLSRSLSHRVLIADMLAHRASFLPLDEAGDDVWATARGVAALSCGGYPVIPCGASDSTLRFLLPVSMALCGGADFTADEELLARPLPVYAGNVRRAGNRLSVRGCLAPGLFCIEGDVSSQFVSGLLFALPLLPGKSRIVLLSPLQSECYVNMTIEILRQYGIFISKTADGYEVPGGQTYRAQGLSPMERDWPAAAAFFAMKALGGDLQIEGLPANSLQGEKAMEEYSRTLPASVDLKDCPELAPALALQAALKGGQITVLHHDGHVRQREKDRIEITCRALNALGAQLHPDKDSISIIGADVLRGGAMDACGDYQVAMMAAAAATRSCTPIVLDGAECVCRAYPAFWRDCKAMGLKIEEVAP